MHHGLVIKKKDHNIIKKIAGVVSGAKKKDFLAYRSASDNVHLRIWVFSIASILCRVIGPTVVASVTGGLW